jgi:hypothetical protein
MEETEVSDLPQVTDKFYHIMFYLDLALDKNAENNLIPSPNCSYGFIENTNHYWAVQVVIVW